MLFPFRAKNLFAYFCFYYTFLFFLYSKDRSEHGILRDMFYTSGNPVDAFRSILYVGIRTVTPPTDFGPLQDCVINQLKDKSVRASRRPEIIFRSLKVSLFNGHILLTILDCHLKGWATSGFYLNSVCLFFQKEEEQRKRGR